MIVVQGELLLVPKNRIDYIKRFGIDRQINISGECLCAHDNYPVSIIFLTVFLKNHVF